jgi:hypothetical protein
MSDIRNGQQKFLFWTDKRPIAPDVETKITCAIAEVFQEAGNAAVVLLQFGTWYFLLGAGSGAVWDEPASAYTHLAIILLLCVMAVIGRHQTPMSNGQPLAFRSGIPEARMRFSRFLTNFTAILFILWFGGLIANMVGYFKALSFEAYGLNGLAILFVLSILINARRAQELLLWVLDLRAQQGHAIPFEPHPMAAPMTVENDWWKKPKSPSP